MFFLFLWWKFDNLYFFIIDHSFILTKVWVDRLFRRLNRMILMGFRTYYPKICHLRIVNILSWRRLRKQEKQEGYVTPPPNHHIPLPLSTRPRSWICVSCSVVSDSVTLWTVAHEAPLSVGFSRREYWSGLPWSSPRDLPNPRDWI